MRSIIKNLWREEGKNILPIFKLPGYIIHETGRKKKSYDNIKEQDIIKEDKLHYIDDLTLVKIIVRTFVLI